ncbi:MAG: hypothetical protein KKB38_20650, partial [Gammaproteobacteria bacterium]|nr:hypothetical protein [Gammaproteobacteria bacterium]
SLIPGIGPVISLIGQLGVGGTAAAIGVKSATSAIDEYRKMIERWTASVVAGNEALTRMAGRLTPDVRPTTAMGRNIEAELADMRKELLAVRESLSKEQAGWLGLGIDRPFQTDRDALIEQNRINEKNLEANLRNLQKLAERERKAQADKNAEAEKQIADKKLKAAEEAWAAEEEETVKGWEKQTAVDKAARQRLLSMTDAIAEAGAALDPDARRRAMSQLVLRQERERRDIGADAAETELLQKRQALELAGMLAETDKERAAMDKERAAALERAAPTLESRFLTTSPGTKVGAMEKKQADDTARIKDLTDRGTRALEKIQARLDKGLQVSMAVEGIN